MRLERDNLNPLPVDKLLLNEKEREGYKLGKGQQVQDVLAVEAELLRSEGIDPAWPGFEEIEKNKVQE
jgi:hypothetical protein